MAAIDWIIIAGYALVVLGIGWRASRQQTNTDEYFRGERKLPWWAIGFSIIATSFSAASLLGGPGEGYHHGFLYLQLQLGDLVGYLLVILLFLPFFVRLNLTTAYEYLEKRFDAKTRSLGSLCFLLFVIARLGGLLYAASLVVATVTGLPLYGAILLVGVVSVVYTATGGIAAVVWTDVLQFAMIFVGLAAGLGAAVAAVPGGFAELWQTAAEGGKLSLVNLTWEPDSIRSLPTALVAYGILAFAVAGTNQQSVQRYVSCADEPSARKAILLGWFSGFVGVAATLLLGVLLFGFYTLMPGLPEDIPADGILPHFIVNQVPPVASGLLVAAIFAAAMSSIDSALHSLATCMTVDFYQRYMRPTPSEMRSLRVAQGLIVVWGILGILSAFYVASTGEALLPFLVKYTTMFLGPLLGIFLMGVLFPRVNATGAFYGTIAAAALLAISSGFGWLSFPGIWQSAITAPLAVLLGLLISLAGSPPPQRSLQGLTLRHRPLPSSSAPETELPS
jgi:SSS family solute:Na+ symporter